ncbi:MAG: hypothetical protein OXU20_12785 [Myxococcales bacterium]|nr:hypothetical protein [Myxococcales bacterium]
MSQIGRPTLASVETWIRALSTSCGPFVGPAEAFALTHGLGHDVPRGGQALSRLAGALRRARASGAIADDARRSLIEGSGALLALVLADRFGHAEHIQHAGNHGLLLGSAGFFDPFECIASALDAPDLGRALVAGVAQAEMEAGLRLDTDPEGQPLPGGHVRRLVIELSAQLATREPSIRLSRRFDTRVWLETAHEGDEIEVDLTRLVEVTRGEAKTRLQASVGRLVTAICDTQRTKVSQQERVGPMDPEIGDRLLPRLVGPGFVARLPTPGDHRRAGKQPLLEPLAGPVQLSLVVAYPGRARYLRCDEVDAQGVEGAKRLALRNMAGRAERARVARVDTEHGPMVMLRSGDGLDAARLLLPGLRDLLRRELGPNLAVGLPHRDLLLACNAHDHATVSAMGAHVADQARRAPHAIYEGLLTVDDDDRIQVLS